MAVIYKCDLCGKEIKSNNGKNPLKEEQFEIPKQDYSAWTSEICPECYYALRDALIQAKYDFWNNRKTDKEQP